MPSPPPKSSSTSSTSSSSSQSSPPTELPITPSPTKPTPAPTAISLSSYLHPLPDPQWTTARTLIISRALSMGYDSASMTELGVNWAHDQDPYGHVASFVYPRYFSICNMRVMEGFGRFVGEEAAKEMLSGKGVGIVARKYETDLRGMIGYPDCTITTNRITDIKPDRYFGITSVWSLAQQIIVAECRGWMVFFDFETSKPANLVEKGGIWKDLYDGLSTQVRETNRLAEEWERRNPPKRKVAKL